MKVCVKSGWTIIQTMLMIAGIALILAFLLSGISNVHISANQSRAKNILKSLASRLEAYKFESSLDSYPQDLSFMGKGERYFTKPFIAGSLSFEHSGYRFVYLPSIKDGREDIDSYNFSCIPLQQSGSGVNSFVMNEGATVYEDKGIHRGTVDKFDYPLM